MTPIENLTTEFIGLVAWLVFWLVVFASGGAIVTFFLVVYYTVTGKNAPPHHKGK